MAKREMPKAPIKSTADEPVTQYTVIPTEPVVHVGIVSGCKRLNVRSKPAMGSAVVDVIEQNTKVTIDLSTSTKEWYSVSIRPGVNGFCLRKFISVQ